MFPIIAKYTGYTTLLASLLLPAEFSKPESPQYDEAYWRQFHTSDDATWSKRSRLSRSLIRKLRIKAGVSDETPEARVYDIKTLPPQGDRQRFLISVAAGNGNCVQIFILERERQVIKRTASIEGFPNKSGICRDGKFSPQIRLLKPATLAVTVRSDSEIGTGGPFPTCLVSKITRSKFEQVAFFSGKEQIPQSFSDACGDKK